MLPIQGSMKNKSRFPYLLVAALVVIAIAMLTLYDGSFTNITKVVHLVLWHMDLKLISSFHKICLKMDYQLQSKLHWLLLYCLPSS